MANMVGDFSSNKTGFMIEAAINFQRTFPGAPIRYADSEHAFDLGYAQRLGLKSDNFEQATAERSIDLVEDWYEDLVAFAERQPVDGTNESLYIVDSIDMLSTGQEKKKDFGQKAFNDKAAQVNELLRRNVELLKQRRVTMIMVSQIRDKLNVMFGEKDRIAGGRGLDFACSQRVWAYKLKQITRSRTRNGKTTKTTTGVRLRLRCKKNKVGAPHRECDVPLLFYYGIDDTLAHVEYLEATGWGKELRELDVPSTNQTTHLRKLSEEDKATLDEALKELVRQAWQDIEETNAPAKGKYD